MRVMHECCNPVLGNSFVNGKMYQGVCIRIKHLLHSSAVRYEEIFHSFHCEIWRDISLVLDFEMSRHISR